MKRYSQNKILFILLVIFAAVGLGFSLIYSRSSTKSDSYEGQPAILTSAKPSVILQINNTITKVMPKISSDILFNLHITAYTTNDAKGNVTYGKTYQPFQFLAVKNGNTWIVITHNTGKTLILPSVTVAKKYNLPTGWFRNS